MKYNKKELFFLEKLDFLARYTLISNKHINDSDKKTENSTKNDVIEIFNSIGYNVKYNHKERFYRFEEISKSHDFAFWISLKYSLVEIGMSGENKITSQIFTIGNYSFHQLQYSLDKEIKIPKKASFKNYNELKEILIDFLLIYKDFKILFLQQF